MSHANCGVCITICTIHPTDARYLLHSNSVTICPKDNVTTCPDVISLTKFVIAEKYGVPYLVSCVQGSVYIGRLHGHEHVNINNIILNYMSEKGLAGVYILYKEVFKNYLFSSTWRISVTRGVIRLNLHVTCLNVILNILPSCEIICISSFHCRTSVTTCICYN